MAEPVRVGIIDDEPLVCDYCDAVLHRDAAGFLIDANGSTECPDEQMHEAHGSA